MFILEKLPFHSLNPIVWFSVVKSFNSDDWANLISDGLGIGLLGASFLVQLPQLISIQTKKNVVGLSESSFLVQTWSGVVFLSYNYTIRAPVLTYIECLPACVETLFIVFLIWRYSAVRFSLQHKIVHVALIIAFASVVLMRLLPPMLVPLLGSAGIPFIICGKAPQIIMNNKQKHTGNLSGASLGMQVAGNAARIFSTVTQVREPFVLASHILAFFGNGIPLVQAFLYREKTRRVLAEEERKRED